jgi:GAF domain-containing protein
MPTDPPETFWGGFMLWIGPHLDRSKWVQAVRVVFIGGAAAATGIAGKVHGVAAGVWLGVGVLMLALTACIEILRESYRSRLRDQDNDTAAAELVAVRSALRPMVESISDMHSLQKAARRERAHNLAQKGADALALVMQNGIPGFRSVVYRHDAAVTVLSVSAWAGRPDRIPGEFRRGEARGDAAFAAIERREPVFVRDVEDDDEVAALGGAYSGTRVGYRTFIAAPVADRQRTYGMVTMDAPNPGDLLSSDQHLVMLIADLLAIAFASVYE